MNSVDVKVLAKEYVFDNRILKAIIKQGVQGTSISQKKFFEAAQRKENILLFGRTGSGKTLAYCIQVVHHLLSSLNVNDVISQVLILLPTTELCSQVEDYISKITQFCSKDVSSAVLCGENFDIHEALLMSRPSVLLCTPAAFMKNKAHINTELISLVVADEADLLLSYGYKSDMSPIFDQLRDSCQIIFVCATQLEEVEDFAKALMKNYVLLRGEDKRKTPQMREYYMSLPARDKDIYLYALMKLNIINTKSLFFVNTIDNCYRLKLLLEQFSIQSKVLNSELPSASRNSIISEFNRGNIDYLIATDESLLATSRDREREETSKMQGRVKRKRDSGITRGVHFSNLQMIVNFDFPASVESYVHRVGRTGRWDVEGTALSFMERDNKGQKIILEKLNLVPNDSGSSEYRKISALKITSKEIEGFRYRVEDVRRAVTRSAILEARRREVAKQMTQSKRLKSNVNYNDEAVTRMRSEQKVHISKVKKHLSHVPLYLLPHNTHEVAHKK